MGREPTLPPKQQGWHEAGFTAKPQPRGADDDAANRHTSFQGPRSCTGFGYRIRTLGTPGSSHRGPSCRRAGAGPGRSRTGSAGTKEHFIRGRREGPRPHRVSTASALSVMWVLSEGLTQPRLDTGSWAAVGAQSLGKQARLFHPLTLPGAGGGPGGCHWPRGVHFLLAFGSWQSATVALGLTRGCRRPPWAPLLPRPPGCSWGTAGSAPALRRRRCLLLADLGLGSGHEASSAPLPTTARRLVHLPRL